MVSLSTLSIDNSFTEEEAKLFSTVFDSNSNSEDVLGSLDLFRFMSFSYLRSVAPRGNEGILHGLDRLITSFSQGISVDGSRCGAIIPPKTIAYKCLDCGADPSCVICADCFLQSPCVNHRFKLVSSGGGTCDCGDPDAWLPSSFCKRHCTGTHASAPDNFTGGDPRVRRVFSAALALALAHPHHRHDRFADIRGPDLLPTLLPWAQHKAESNPALRDALAGAFCIAPPPPPAGESAAAAAAAEGWLLAAALDAAADSEREGHAAAAFAVLLALIPVPAFKDAAARAFAALYARLLRAAPAAAAAPAVARRVELVAKLSVQLLTVPSVAANIAYAPAGGGPEGLLPALLRWVSDACVKHGWSALP
jgi:hypothetical protein